MSELSNLKWRVTDCQTQSFAWPDGVCDLWLAAPATLVVNTFRDLLFFDASDPLRIRLLHRRKTEIDRIVRTRLCGTALVCCGDEGVHVLDIADPSAPRTLSLHTKLKGQLVAGWLVDDAVWTPGGSGIESLDLNTGAITPLCVAPGVKKSDGHGADILVTETNVVTACASQGVQVYTRAGSAVVHAKGWKQDTACRLTADGRDAAFDVGESESLARFVLGSKPAKQKLWKTPGTWLAPQVVRRGSQILSAGLRLPDTDELLILVADTAGDAPQLLSKTKVPGFVSRDQCSDSMRGLVAVGDVLLVASYARRLYAVVGEG